MKLHQQLLFLFLVYGSGSAAPFDKGDHSNANAKRGLQVLKTTVAKNGFVIDWVQRKSQVKNGKLATAPPLPADVPVDSNRTTSRPLAILEEDDADLGPAGTVPVLRLTSAKSPVDIKGKPVDKQHPADFGIKAVGDHWYASSAQNVANLGGSAAYSMYKAYTQSGGDFSLLQAAVIRYDVPKPGDNSQIVSQTVEAGWINYPNQVAAPHLFTFFTTDGYASNADFKGGWNRDVQGWVQVDNQIFPGTAFSSLSVRGGTQYEMKIQWLLTGGNWWLFVLDRWIGYYPASLFGAGTDAGRSLQTSASAINYYGEIYDSHPDLTTTDMGSGNFPEQGFGQAAYIRSMVYTDLNSNDQKYDGSRGVVISDANRYRMFTDWSGATNWGAYMFLGGPGAGGVIDG